MTDEELASQPGGVVTRSEDDADAAEHVFSPKDFRLNLRSRLGVEKDEALPDLDSPAIRKLTWEHVVPDRPTSMAPNATTTVPLPPPNPVPPPLPPQPAAPLQPPAPVAPAPVVSAPVAPSRDVQPVVDDVSAVEDTRQPNVEAAAAVTVAEPDDELSAVVDIIDEETDEVPEEAIDDEPDLEVEVEVPPAPAAAARTVAGPEVNRLASVPDLFGDEDDTPIELPPITPSGPGPVVTQPPVLYAPVLAENFYIPPPQRPATTTVATIMAEGNSQRRGNSKKPKRHLFRTFVTLVLLFGLLAGGAFAAKKYLLHEATWSVEIKPLADEVATARGLQFETPVAVTEVPIAEYSRRLVSATVGTATDRAPMWRALGVLNGELDLEAIGHQAVNDSPAFYEPSTKSIVVTDDLKSYQHLYRFALRRALVSALLDQQFDWSTSAGSASPSAALAIRATIDGDALAIANTLAAADEPDQLAPELFSFVQGHGITVSPSQYLATISGRPGVTMRAKVSAMAKDPASLAALEQAVPGSDALLDSTATPSATPAPAGTQGMMFWYYVLASRLDDGQAWNAATHWAGDSVTTSTGGSAQCVDANVTAADADGAAVLLSAFQAWAAFAPAETTTTVAPGDGGQITIRACDPSAPVAAAVPVKIPVGFGGAAVEEELVQTAVSAAGGTGLDPACLVRAARARGPVLALPTDDAPSIAVGWQPAFVAANLDLAPTCVTPAG